MSQKAFDYIIVGAGTAGCLLANRLSLNPDKSVLLIEAGGKDNYHWIHIPVGYLYCIGNQRTDWMYQTEPDAGLNGRQLRYPRGKVLGGCSSINAMLYLRGQSRDYEHWADITGDEQWRWTNVESYFTAHEDHHSGVKAHHASKVAGTDFLHHESSRYAQLFKQHKAGGEWRVERQRLRWDILDAFAEAAHQIGIPKVDDFNTGNNEGVSFFEVNQRKGWRWNTSKAFLREIQGKRPNLTVMTNTQVKKLITQKSDGALRCSGLLVETTQGEIQLTANDSVILSAGAVGSPQILELSGLGQADRLRALDIPVVTDLPGVGESLQDHLQIRSVYKVNNVKTLNTIANSWLGKISIAMEYAFKRSGPMSMAPSQLGAFTRSSDDYQWPNIEYHVQPLSLDAFGEPLHPYPAITASVCNLNPSSRGHVHIDQPDNRQSPKIVTNYLSTDEDRKVAADSLRVTRKIVEQSALSPYQPEELKPGMQYQTDEELARVAGDIGTTIFHPVGTARMGRVDDPQAVTDPRLRVRDGQGGVIKGLRLVDASVMPTITSGNTNSPTLMIAEKAAQWIAQEDWD
ncbi:MAG: GMC family oxidoreductase [Sedimenticolaceae bacterium]